jgi:hypothetical protein
MTQTQCFAQRLYSVRRLQRPIELPHLETFPGAACLPTHRAARLQSGSPPGVQPAQPAACLQRFWVPFSLLITFISSLCLTYPGNCPARDAELVSIPARENGCHANHEKE